MAKPDSIIIPGLLGKIMEYCGGLTCSQPGIHQATFSLPFLNGTGEEKTLKKAHGLREEQGDHSPVTVLGKTDSIWEKVF